MENISGKLAWTELVCAQFPHHAELKESGSTEIGIEMKIARMPLILLNVQIDVFLLLITFPFSSDSGNHAYKIQICPNFGSSACFFGGCSDKCGMNFGWLDI